VAVPVMLKAALPSIPIVNRLPGVRKDPSADPSTLSLRRDGVVVGRDHVAAYSRVCGFPTKDTAPLPYLHVLAFPLHLAAMTSPQFPYPAIGTVHVENSITAHRPVRLGERVDVSVRVSGTRPHPKGRVMDFLASVHAGDELVWESRSTYLRRGHGDDAAPRGLVLDRVPPGTVEWRLPGDLGRRYAAASGDRNPIHLHPLTAKPLGFPRQIAHGMWSLGRCVAALENRLPDAVTVDVAFRKPILLPGTVAFGHERTPDGQVFALTSPKDGAPHLVGRASSYVV
jgi:acyl dehydratase